MTRTFWYRRNGARVAKRLVSRSQTDYALSKRTGRMGPLRCSIQPTVAESIERMTLKEYASWTGYFTWRDQNQPTPPDCGPDAVK